MLNVSDVNVTLHKIKIYIRIECIGCYKNGKFVYVSLTIVQSIECNFFHRHLLSFYNMFACRLIFLWKWKMPTLLVPHRNFWEPNKIDIESLYIIFIVISLKKVVLLSPKVVGFSIAWVQIWLQGSFMKNIHGFILKNFGVWATKKVRIIGLFLHVFFFVT